MDGGVDFLESENVEYERYGIFRQFKIFGNPQKEKYSSKVYPSSGFYDDKRIKLRSLEFYKTLAKIRMEPTYHNPQGNPRDNRYFKDIVFEGEGGFNSVKYNRVLPLYGYGDWRRAPVFDHNRYGERNRSHDMSNAINSNRPFKKQYLTNFCYCFSPVSQQPIIANKDARTVSGN